MPLEWEISKWIEEQNSTLTPRIPVVAIYDVDIGFYCPHQRVAIYDRNQVKTIIFMASFVYSTLSIYNQESAALSYEFYSLPNCQFLRTKQENKERIFLMKGILVT